MLDRLKAQWSHLARDPPGKRFRMRYERRKRERRSPFVRVAWTVAALLLVVAGIVALPLPGPGSVVIVIGLAVLAQESLALARLCDRAEVALRGLFGRR
jgi:uncharacterized protein (TIGR02611 family)